MVKDDYELNVVCTNCGKTDTIKIPFGTKFEGVGFCKESSYACNYCGCYSLLNEDW